MGSALEVVGASLAGSVGSRWGGRGWGIGFCGLGEVGLVVGVVDTGLDGVANAVHQVDGLQVDAWASFTGDGLTIEEGSEPPLGLGVEQDAGVQDGLHHGGFLVGEDEDVHGGHDQDGVEGARGGHDDVAGVVVLGEEGLDVFVLERVGYGVRELREHSVDAEGRFVVVQGAVRLELEGVGEEGEGGLLGVGGLEVGTSSFLGLVVGVGVFVGVLVLVVVLGVFVVHWMEVQ